MIGAAIFARFHISNGDAARRQLARDFDDRALEIRAAVIVARERVAEVARHDGLAHGDEFFVVRCETLHVAEELLLLILSVRRARSLVAAVVAARRR
jgi:hypothetical protein